MGTVNQIKVVLAALHILDICDTAALVGLGVGVFSRMAHGWVLPSVCRLILEDGRTPVFTQHNLASLSGVLFYLCTVWEF